MRASPSATHSRVRRAPPGCKVGIWLKNARAAARKAAETEQRRAERFQQSEQYGPSGGFGKSERPSSHPKSRSASVRSSRNRACPCSGHRALGSQPHMRPSGGAVVDEGPDRAAPRQERYDGRRVVGESAPAQVLLQQPRSGQMARWTLGSWPPTSSTPGACRVSSATTASSAGAPYADGPMMRRSRSVHADVFLGTPGSTSRLLYWPSSRMLRTRTYETRGGPEPAVASVAVAPYSTSYLTTPQPSCVPLS
ncbi:hypothetical protein C3492_26805 [Streptomyces sp. Ru62]|nr:hypothetical protein C3492_26805 [Streptomyces sp. Ru62]